MVLQPNTQEPRISVCGTSQLLADWLDTSAQPYIHLEYTFTFYLSNPH